MLKQALQQRQRESGCFAGAGLGRTHDVLAREHHGNGLRLNGRHVFVAHFGHGFGQTWGQREL